MIYAQIVLLLMGQKVYEKYLGEAFTKTFWAVVD